MKQWHLRILGLFGILGGLTLFAGDMLLYYNPSSQNIRVNMSKVSDLRIIASALTALFATWFYLLGVVSVYYAFKPSKPKLRNIVAACFVCLFTAYGVIHGAYIAIATSAKLASQYNLDIKQATALASKANNTMRLVGYPIFGVLSFVFIRQVLNRKTLYPKWIILFFPLLPFLFQGLVDKYIPLNLWIIVSGGYFNLILVLFFTASTIALWNKGN